MVSHLLRIQLRPEAVGREELLCRFGKVTPPRQRLHMPPEHHKHIRLLQSKPLTLKKTSKSNSNVKTGKSLRIQEHFPREDYKGRRKLLLLDTHCVGIDFDDGRVLRDGLQLMSNRGIHGKRCFCARCRR